VTVFAVEAEGLWKRFRFQDGRPRTLKEVFLLRKRGGEERHFWALKDVTFRIPRGAFWGIVGGNGSGKTTLFRVLSGVMPPDRGTVAVRGSLSPVVDLMAGFNEDLTGFENARLGMTFHPMTAGERARRIDEALEFAELGEFVHMPVRYYSSGMLLRLGFALAVTADAEVFLIDEVLAVGDLAFQRKCFDRLEAFRREGKTVVLVSHAMSQIERNCDYALWLSAGELKAEGEPGVVTERYAKASLETPGRVAPEIR
jgi:ABC-2 type transport system ATP-binding protein